MAHGARRKVKKGYPPFYALGREPCALRHYVSGSQTSKKLLQPAIDRSRTVPLISSKIRTVRREFYQGVQFFFGLAGVNHLNRSLNAGLEIPVQAGGYEGRCRI